MSENETQIQKTIKTIEKFESLIFELLTISHYDMKTCEQLKMVVESYNLYCKTIPWKKEL